MACIELCCRHTLARTRFTCVYLQDGKVKRKVGRPIAYSGDPFSPDLEPEQRRVILRRIANRESARRVRARRQDELDRLSQRVSCLNSALSGNITSREAAFQTCERKGKTCSMSKRSSALHKTSPVFVRSCWQLHDLETHIASSHGTAGAKLTDSFACRCREWMTAMLACAPS